jgi:DNA-binding IclR family transcriptional regulator
MKQRTKEASRHIDVVMRTLDILDCFQKEAALSLKEIIDRTGVNRSRVMRIVGTLEARGYLVEDAARRTYYPGVKLAILGKSFDRYNHIEIIARPVVSRLARETGESATFFVADRLERVALVREEGTHAIRLSVKEGQRTPIHAGASGKVLIAFGPEDLLQRLSGQQRLDRITARTITDPEELAKAVAIIRKQGYAVSKGENLPDAHAIAAPVFDFDRKLVGALGIAGPSSRFNDAQIKTRLKIILEAAQELCEKFGQPQPG